MFLRAGVNPFKIFFYECEMCKKTFSQSGNLARHSMTHTGKKPYEYEIYKKAFISSCT